MFEPQEVKECSSSSEEDAEGEEDLSTEKCSAGGGEVGSTVSTFESLGVTNWIRRQLSCLGITTPSPVQTQCIPPIMKGKQI